MRYYLLGTFVRKGGHSNCQLFAELIVPPHTAGILILFMSFPINNYFSLNYLLVCTRRMIFYKSMSMLHIVFVVIIWVLFVVDWLHCARCTNIFPNKSALQSHMYVHMGPGKF